MPPFYARYVPPSKTASSAESNVNSSPKRKRTEVSKPGTDVQTEKKKRKIDRVPDNRPEFKKGEQSASKPSRRRDIEGKDVLNKYRVSEFVKTQDTDIEVAIRKSSSKSTNGAEVNKSKEKDNTHDFEQQDEDAEAVRLDEPGPQKHATLLSKFKRAKARTSLNVNEPVQPDAQKGETIEEHGLEPIPQPATVNEPASRLTYSTRLAWQSGARVVEHSTRTNFEDMGLSAELLKSLRHHNLLTAFPVQSAVIPLLLDRSPGDKADLCISAATGSGKTLSYVLPIMEALRVSKKAGLKAVIVVPTRELVKQVKETCELCASGSNVNIVTAVGNRSLKSEQDALVEQEDVYDPGEWERQQNARIDWTTFSLEKALKSSKDKASSILSRNFVTRNRFKADLLITTPGRLVDHLKSTPGFHLDNVEWLVVDEADRLLNESYQEWVETVVPALQSRKASEERDRCLSHMRLDLPPRVVRKILLSATMTQDISKLNALKLHEPKLIVLRSSANADLEQNANSDHITDLGAPQDHQDEQYHLPTELTETALILSRQTDKPLVLLDLLKDQSRMARRYSLQEAQLEEDSSDGLSSSTNSDSDSDSDDSGSSSTTSADDTASSDTSSTTENSVASEQRSATKTRDSLFQKKNQQATHLKKSYDLPRALVFTRSTASATRLSRLLSILSPALAARISVLTRSTAASASSRQALSSFRGGKTTILIATDRASRGIDIPDLENVINYDIPGNALTYIHRVGRTARAGKKGHAWTLVEHREGRWFWNEIGGKGNDCKIRRIEKMNRTDVKLDDEQLKTQYEHALAELGKEVRGE